MKERTDQLQQQNNEKLLPEALNKIKTSEKKNNHIDSKQEIQSILESLDLKRRELVTLEIQLSQRNHLLEEVKSKLRKIESKRSIESVIKYIESNTYSDKQWKRFTEHFEKVHPNFFSKLRQQCESLTEHEMRICAYIRMRMDNKSITSILCISPKGLETARYRLKRKLELTASEDLNDFILKL